ncbi:DUF3293 domain-containing protein [Arenimonas aestuarii]
MDAPRFPPPASMMQGFADAVYRVHGDGEVISLRIGQANPAMAALMARHGARHGGLVTGENPFGQQQSAQRNAAANDALRAAIDAIGLVRVASDGGSEDGAWNEPGFLVLGGDDGVLDRLSRRFRQAAWVRISADGTAQLAACRYPLASSGETPCWPSELVPGP